MDEIADRRIGDTEQPTNRELMHFIKEIHGQIKEVKENFVLLNGSVSRIKTWKERVIGASGVVVVMILPLLTWALIEIRNIDGTIQKGIESELTKYEIIIK